MTSRVFPTDCKLVAKDNKSYIDFPKEGTGIMLADKLYHSTGEKAGQRVKLTKKLCDTISCPQPGVGWYASEKYDGLRGIWTGQELVSRPMKDANTKNMRGKVFTYVPKFFTDLLPKGVALDGEIWMGRGKFQQVAGLSNLKISKTRTEEDLIALWRDVVFMVFDCPSDPRPYEVRMEALGKLLKGKGSNIKIVPTYLITSDEQLMKIYKDLTSKGAEGVMLRAPKSPYEIKRSKFLLKMKVQDDSEAQVKGYFMGTGKYVGKLGSLKCAMSDGTEFSIGTGLTDEIRDNYNNPESQHYIPIGSTVSFSYMELTDEGIPRHPAYRGIRVDVEVLADYLPKIKVAFGDIIKKLQTDRPPNYGFKISSYKKALAAFDKAPKIESVKDALDALRASGQKLEKENPDKPKTSLLLKVKEIIRTGTCAEADKAALDPKINAVEKLTKIEHVGDVRAGELYDRFGVCTPEELERNEEACEILTDAQKIGLKYYTDLQERIPRKEMDAWNKNLNAIATGRLSGSYRRGKPDSGDIDFLLSGGNKVIATFLEKLGFSKKIEILGCFGQGDTQWQGVMKLKKKGSLARHVDLFCYEPEVAGFALLHSTGSYEFNIKCRNRAIEMGYSLNQYKLKPVPKDLVLEGNVEEKERSILEYLGIGWVEPRDRV